MKDIIILEGKNYISARRASKLMNYAQDYVGQLCRGGKVDARMIGRSWFVTEESLKAHRESTIDNTPEERAQKFEKKIETTTRETIQESIQEIKQEKVLSPIEPTVTSTSISSFKYETEKRSLLPELNKKVPILFTLPKNISNLTHTRFLKPLAPQHRRTAHHSSTLTLTPVLSTLVIAFIALSGLFFTVSFSSTSRNSLSYSGNQASIASVTSGIISKIFGVFGLGGKTAPVARNTVSNNSINEVASSTGGIAGFNGISVIPSQSVTADEVAKSKIKNSFSDEVTIQPDKSGTAGVIKPVFKKGDSNDFVYVLVPVKEKKQ